MKRLKRMAAGADETTPPWASRAVPTGVDVLAPDGSEIRLLVAVAGASMVHCRLPAGEVTGAVRHRTVDELWYVLAGSGQIWRSSGNLAQTLDVRPGVALTIPVGTAFQFRADPGEPLVLLIATVPPWPGADEAVPVPGVWG